MQPHKNTPALVVSNKNLGLMIVIISTFVKYSYKLITIILLLLLTKDKKDSTFSQVCAELSTLNGFGFFSMFGSYFFAFVSTVVSFTSRRLACCLIR